MESFDKKSFSFERTWVENVSALYRKPWFVKLLFLCFSLISIISITSTWIIFYDVSLQTAGLVFDKAPDYLIYLLFMFGFFELGLFFINCLIWYKLIHYKSSDWIVLDLFDLIKLSLAELPIGILLVLSSACQESSISIGQFIKALVLVIYVVFRFAFCLTTFVSGVLDSTYTDLDTISPAGTSHTSSSSSNEAEEDSNKLLWPKWLRVDNLRIRSGLIRIFLIIGLLALFVLGIVIFNFSFHQTYHGYLEWHRINQDSKITNPLIDKMAERYFHDVEIFMQESPQVPNKWLHLISLEKLMKLHYLNVKETIKLNHLKWNNQIIVEFVQTLNYPNGTREKSRTCWVLLNVDLFREQDCDDALGSADNDDSSKVKTELLKSIWLEFLYKPPSKRQHLGEILYKSTRVNENATIILNYPITLQYFQNPVVHRSMRPSSLREIDNSHHHDGWTSGPYRPKLFKKSQFFMPYDARNGDIVSVSEIWRTGLGKCRTNAPIGPTVMTFKEDATDNK